MTSFLKLSKTQFCHEILINYWSKYSLSSIEEEQKVLEGSDDSLDSEISEESKDSQGVLSRTFRKSFVKDQFGF